jgi:hypothetical protein
MKKEGLKILSAEIVNFKNISQKRVDFDGKSAIIIGKNNAGKSSLIQAIMSPLDSKMVPDKAIKEGEERGSIELEIGGVLRDKLVRYTVGMYFSPENSKGRLSVTNDEDGQLPNTRTAISDLVGVIGFDMMDFIRLGKTKDGRVSKPGVREQIEILKKLMPQEVIEKLYALDKEHEKAYSDRAEINKDIKYKSTMLEGHGYSQEDIEKYSEVKDASKVKESMSNLSSEIEKHSGVVSKLEGKKSEFVLLEGTIARLTAELEKAKKDKESLSAEIKAGEVWLEKNTKPDIDTLSKELEEINAHNEKHKGVVELEKSKESLGDSVKQATDITNRLSAIKDEKKAIFGNNPLPVKGLTFDDEQIMLKGLPLNDGQINTATLIGIGCRIGMAMNPNLRLMIIKDGSLLDQKTLNFILKICEDKGYQVLIEMVDQEGGDLSVQFTEDYIK